MKSRPALLRLLAAALTVVFAALGGTIILDSDPARPGSVVIRLDAPANPDGGTARVVADTDHQAEPHELQAAEDPAGPGEHEDLADEQPAGAPPDAAARIQDSPTAGIGAPAVVGGAERISCRPNPVRNQSSRGGSRTRIFVLHYTVSSPGSLDAIRRLFDTPSFAASSHYGLEPTGRCERWVHPSQKAWTQGAFNPVSESVEIIARGTEPRSWWLAQPIIKDGLLADLVRTRLRANGLPLKRVDPVGCAVQQAGWTDHDALECGNTHHDVTPSFPYDVLQRQLDAGVCDQRCKRARTLRAKHRQIHRWLDASKCLATPTPAGEPCRHLLARNRVIHQRARLKKIRLTPR